MAGLRFLAWRLSSKVAPGSQPRVIVKVMPVFCMSRLKDGCTSVPCGSNPDEVSVPHVDAKAFSCSAHPGVPLRKCFKRWRVRCKVSCAEASYFW
mmetsp:Transcript_44657/g.123786  ORF Transcript_44657/g.123786 Transcript_44657/m.123786 type:complete len:95 (+) Transcript_44657:326-610(+)